MSLECSTPPATGPADWRRIRWIANHFRSIVRHRFTTPLFGQLGDSSVSRVFLHRANPVTLDTGRATPEYDTAELQILGGAVNMGSSDSLPTLDSLHFPSAQQSISQVLSSLRRSALSVSNRLESIETDAAFAQEVAGHYDLPLVANERCGSWYIPPAAKSGSAYFKSTDGHSGQWDFSFRRLNLQLLPLAREHGG